MDAPRNPLRRNGGVLRALALVLATLAHGPSRAQVLAHQKISDTQGGFAGTLDVVDFFGQALASLGDLDGDGVGDLAVGSHFDGDGGTKRGAVWIVFLQGDGTVKAEQKISDLFGGFGGVLAAGDVFGSSLAALGDVDGDGVQDLAVGAPDDDDGGSARGAVWILFLNADGTVKAEQKLSSSSGGLVGPLDDADLFGSSLAALEDLDGNGVRELAVGARGDDDGGMDRGAVWVLSLAANGTVVDEQKISAVAGGFGGALVDRDAFGASVAHVGDLDGDGVGELAVGSLELGFLGKHPTGPPSAGAVWVLALNADGTVKTQLEIGEAQGGFTGALDVLDRFGAAVAALGDLDGDGIGDLAVGAPCDDDGGATSLAERGSVWLVFLDGGGSVRGQTKISDTEGSFQGMLDNFDRFGSSVTAVGDLDGNGVVDLAVGAPDDDDGGSAHGAVWLLFLGPTAPAVEVVRLGDPPNPPAFLAGATSGPVIGAVWDPLVSPFHPGAFLDVAWVSLQPQNQPSAAGTILCDPPMPGLLFTSPPGVPFQLAIPLQSGLVGASFCTQGGSLGTGSLLALANALDITVGTF